MNTFAIPNPHEYSHRKDPATIPKHIIVGFITRGVIQAIVHTAGSDILWLNPAKRLANNEKFVSGLDPHDAVWLGANAVTGNRI